MAPITSLGLRPDSRAISETESHVSLLFRVSSTSRRTRLRKAMGNNRRTRSVSPLFKTRNSSIRAPFIYISFLMTYYLGIPCKVQGHPIYHDVFLRAEIGDSLCVIRPFSVFSVGISTFKKTWTEALPKEFGCIQSDPLKKNEVQKKKKRGYEIISALGWLPGQGLKSRD